MPDVIVKLMAGRTDQQKARIAEAVTKGITKTTSNGEDAVSVAIEDVELRQKGMPKIRHQSDLQLQGSGGPGHRRCYGYGAHHGAPSHGGSAAVVMKQQSIGRLGRADEVAAAVLWLCSPGASFVIGVGLPVDGGFAAH
jgi:phenylpyruvate tautomerase PptA (4-oxalocrotonate tautomerase family)